MQCRVIEIELFQIVSCPIHYLPPWVHLYARLHVEIDVDCGKHTVVPEKVQDLWNLGLSLVELATKVLFEQPREERQVGLKA